ncbi:ParB N-terminal domain-containing protein [Streptomyces sp. SID8354]|nr:ParB N-terminal domain-containing protein [Streptomyces sp. SID8354]
MSAATRIPASLADLAIPVDELAPYHRNPRTGDLDSITESLSTHSQYRPIVVNRGTLTGRPNEILAGNHTFKAAKQLDWTDIAVTWLDVDDDAAAKRPVGGQRPAAGRQPGNGRPHRRAQRLCPPDQPWSAGLAGRLDAAGPCPQVRAAAEDGTTASPGRTRGRMADGSNPACTADE